jgi:hypothetical protein
MALLTRSVWSSATDELLGGPAGDAIVEREVVET